jgi:hypothetical protein
LKLSCSVRLAGQVDWNLRFFVCALAENATIAAAANTVSDNALFMGSLLLKGEDGRSGPGECQ